MINDPIIGLVAMLKASSDLTAIVGSHIQPIPAPEDPSDYPCITFQVTSEVQDYNFQGSDNVNTTRVVFNCFAQQYSDARSAALVIKKLLSGFTGVLPDGTIVFETEIVTVQDGWVDGSRMSKVSTHVLLTYSS